jgi:hypothetical protein
MGEITDRQKNLIDKRFAILKEVVATRQTDTKSDI